MNSRVDMFRLISLSPARKKLLEGKERAVADHYFRNADIRETAKTFGMSTEEVLLILKKTEKYVVRKRRDNTDAIDYVNELSPGALKHGEGVPFEIVCAAWIKDDDELIIDILKSGEGMYTAEQLAEVTGFPERRIIRTFSMLDKQNRNAEARKTYFKNMVEWINSIR